MKLEQRVEEILRRAASEIADAVRDDISHRMAKIAEELGVARLKPTPAPAAKPEPKKKRKRPPIMCVGPRCNKPGAGPKYGWFCVEHHNSLTPKQKGAARKKKRVRPR